MLVCPKNIILFVFYKNSVQRTEDNVLLLLNIHFGQDVGKEGSVDGSYD